MQTKLTLSIAPRTKAVIKRISKQQGISISKMVADYFATITDAADNNTAIKQLHSFRGVLKNEVASSDAAAKADRYAAQLKHHSKHIK